MSSSRASAVHVETAWPQSGSASTRRVTVSPCRNARRRERVDVRSTRCRQPLNKSIYRAALQAARGNAIRPVFAYWGLTRPGGDGADSRAGQRRWRRRRRGQTSSEGGEHKGRRLCHSSPAQARTSRDRDTSHICVPVSSQTGEGGGDESRARTDVERSHRVRARGVRAPTRESPMSRS